MLQKWQPHLAEVFGTFTLVFVGATAVVGFGGSAAPVAFGIGLLAALYAFGATSGGHFNPILTLGMFLDRRMGLRLSLEYWAAQFVGAVLGALALLLMTNTDDVAKAATVPGIAGVRGAFFAEVFLSAIFVIVVLTVTKSTQHAGTVYVAIALTLLAIHFAAVPFSGSSVNPARSFGTALIGNKWTDFWIYIIAPPAGAILGWIIYAIVIKGDTNLRDDFDSMRKEVEGGLGSSGGGTAAG